MPFMYYGRSYSVESFSAFPVHARLNNCYPDQIKGAEGLKVISFFYFLLLGGFDFAWYCSFYPVAEKTNQKKLVASIARLPVPASHNPTEATGYTFLVSFF